MILKTLYRYISSAQTTLILLVGYAVGLACATIIEKYHGTDVAKSLIYHSYAFFFLQLLLVLNFIAVTIKGHYLRSRKRGMLIVHTSFIVILLGALTSYIFGKEGIAHIREGETINSISVNEDGKESSQPLPFSIELVDFTLDRYDGSHSPSSYRSEVMVHKNGESRKADIYMNNVLDIDGYRFFQSSYDRDEKGTVLSVNQDVWGRNITYFGYFMLLVGFVFCFIDKNSRFRVLNRRLALLIKESKTLSVIILLSLVCARAEAISINDIERYSVDRSHAARFGSLPMQSDDGRMKPINTFSAELLRKLHKSNTIGTLNSDQFLLGLLSLPELWYEVPFIAIPNEQIAHKFELPQGMCSYSELFDENGNYILASYIDNIYNDAPNKRDGFDKDLLKLDEKINILHQLFAGQLLCIFPLESDPKNRWYATGDELSHFKGQDSMFVSRITQWYLAEVRSGIESGSWNKANEVLDMIATYQQAKGKGVELNSKKIETELSYNKLNIFRTCKIGYLSLGGLLLIFSLLWIAKDKKAFKIAFWILSIGVLILFVYHTFGIALRWYIGGSAPWSNSYGTMLYVAWATLLGGLLFIRKSSVTFALATIFAGVILFVSSLNWMDPQISTLVPVLKSPWLMFHVAVIVGAYGFFGISFLIGVVNLSIMSFDRQITIKPRFTQIRQLSIVSEMSMIIGVALMAIGIFLGAIWANESWGRYWGWDPKETWALISLIVYVLILHLHLVRRLSNEWWFNFASIVAFASILMTFFGVNYLLSGMHSYGGNNDISGIMVYLYIAIGVVALLATLSYKNYHKQKLS